MMIERVDSQSSRITVRGLTTGGPVNPSVGVAIDDVAFGSEINWGGGHFVPDVDPGDLARIELLRGPQGTLYGASSLGGLLKYVTIDPSTDRWSGRVQLGSNAVSGGDSAGYSVRGSANVPLSDSFALRASAFDYAEPGYVDNVNTGRKDVNEVRGRGGRLAALWRASESVTLKLDATTQRVDPQGSPLISGSVGDLKQNLVAGAGVYNKENQGYSATLKAQLGKAELTILTGYNVTKNAGTDDAGSPTQYTFDTHADKFVQELRLVLPLGERIDWLAGAFYTKEKFAFVEGLPVVDPVTGEHVPFIDPTGTSYPGGLLDSLDSAGTHQEIAAFTNFTFKLSDRLNVQVGGRQAHYKGDFQQVWTGYLAVCCSPTQVSPFLPPHVSYNDDAFTYLVTPSFKITPDWMLYVRLASGYRTGGPNGGLGIDILPVMKPDKTQNYELGIKGNFLDQKISIDASAYYIDWHDIQLLTGYVLGNGTSVNVYTNGDTAKSQGLELSFALRPWHGFETRLWGAWNQAELTADMPTNLLTDAHRGDPLPDAPHFSSYLSVNQDFALGQSVLAYVGGSVSHVGAFINGFGMSRAEISSYTKANLTSGVRFNTWDIGFYINNVTDKRGTIGYDPRIKTGLPIQPRTIGLNLTKTFAP